MKEQNNPLSSLIVDDVSMLNLQRLADFLKSYVAFDKETQQIVLLSGFIQTGSTSNKIELLLIAAKAKSLLFGVKEGLTQGEIIKFDFAPEGTIKPAIKRLYDSKRISKNKELAYYLPNYAVDKIIGELSKDKADNRTYDERRRDY